MAGSGVTLSAPEPNDEDRAQCHVSLASRGEQGTNCDLYGACFFVPAPTGGGMCVARNDAACKRSAGCALAGACVVRERRCAPASDDDCRAAQVCAAEGRCVAGTLECEASEATCLAAKVCRSSGRCGARKGRCVATTDEACRASAGCAEDGRCALHRATAVCEPGSDADCEHSAGCAELGDCSRVETAHDVFECREP